jgi:hypothetical protein
MSDIMRVRRSCSAGSPFIYHPLFPEAEQLQYIINVIKMQSFRNKLKNNRADLSGISDLMSIMGEQAGYGRKTEPEANENRTGGK